MPHFVNNPNLPLDKVCVVAIGEDYFAEIGAALLPYGIKTIACPNNPFVDTRLQSHIDLSVFHAGENRFVISSAVSQSAFIDELKRMGAELFVSNTAVLPNYPNDAAFCALSTGDMLFHNLKYSDSLLLNLSLTKVHVNQGYAKCAACLINNKAAITSDHGLAKAMKSEGFDVLEICSDGIKLEGFGEGFIGGAAFKIAKDKLAFTGVLCNRPDKSAIEGFLDFHKITPVFLTDKPIFDIGSALPIMEQ